MSERRYGIIGAGALGAFYGALLHKAGREVHFLFHNDYAHVQRHGLRIDSHWGDFVLPRVNAHASASQMPPCDVVCIGLKTTSNHLLAGILPRVTRPGGVVLVMQNGLGAEEEIAALLPEAQVGGGLCYLCANRAGPGHINHSDCGQIALGAHSAGMDGVLQAIMEDFRAAGVPVELAAGLQAARWKKLVWNIPYNGLSVVLNATTEEIMACPQTTELARGLMLEVLAGARACGSPVDETHADKMLDFTRKMKPYKPSMKLDHEAGRPLETEYLYRRPVSAARAHGVALPKIEMLAAELEFLDKNRNRK